VRKVFSDILEFGFVHREVTVDERFVVSTGESAPRVHAHLIANRDAVHLRRSADYKFVHAVLVLALQAEG